MTLLLRMRNEMSQMQVGKMATVGSVRDVVSKDVDLDAKNPHLTATKSGEEMHLDERETPTGSLQADVIGSNSVCVSIRDDGNPLPPPGEACASAASDVRGVAECNHIGEANSVVKLSSPSSSSAIGSSNTACALTNSVVDAGQAVQACAAVTSADVNNTDPVAVSEPVSAAVVSIKLEPSTIVAQSMSTAEGTTALADVKDVISVQATAPGSPHGVTVPSIRTNTVNMVLPPAVAPSAALRTLAPRIIVSTSPATTVLRVQTAAGSVTTQPLPTVPSQQLILPVRNQGTAIPRVWCSFFNWSIIRC